MPRTATQGLYGLHPPGACGKRVVAWNKAHNWARFHSFNFKCVMGCNSFEKDPPVRQRRLTDPHARHTCTLLFYEVMNMPTYEYACKSCAHEWEAEQSIKEDPLKECPKCHQETARRQISRGTGFILKGGGWYSDLYASSGNKPQGGSGGSSDSGSSNSSSSGSSSSSSSSSGSTSGSSSGSTGSSAVSAA